MFPLNNDADFAPFPDLPDIGDAYDSAEEADLLKAREEQLYSLIHFAQQDDHDSHEVSRNVTLLEDEQEVTKGDSSSSESEDDGIQVLDVPAPVNQAENMDVIVLSSDNDDDEDDYMPSAKKSRPSPPRERVTVQHVQSSSRHKPAKPVLLNISSSSSDLSSDDDDEMGVSASLNLNVVGRGSDKYRTLSEILNGDFSVAERESRLTYPKWTAEMHEFYNTVDYARADITLDEIRAGMSTDPADWKVERRLRPLMDGSVSNLESRRQSGVRCYNCMEFGHLKRDCTSEPKMFVCALCGSTQHNKYNCPDARGVNGAYRFFEAAICSICDSQGHEALHCPDQWRRYHVTVDGLLNVPECDPHRPQSEMYCANCAAQGHYSFQCSKPRHWNMPKVAVKTVVFSYKELSRRRMKKDTKSAKKKFKEVNNPVNSKRNAKFDSSRKVKNAEKLFSLASLPKMTPTVNLDKDDGDDIVQEVLKPQAKSTPLSFQEKRAEQRKKKKFFKSLENKNKHDMSYFKQSTKNHREEFNRRGFITSNMSIYNESPSSTSGLSRPQGKSGGIRRRHSSGKLSSGNNKSSSPTTCPKSVQKTCTLLAREIRRCSKGPRSKGVRSRAADELTYLRNSVTSNSVSRNDRKRIESILKDFNKQH